MTPMKTLIVAPDATQAFDYARQNHIPRQDVVYITREYQLNGRADVDVVIVNGGPDPRRDTYAEGLLEMIGFLQRTGRIRVVPRHLLKPDRLAGYVSSRYPDQAGGGSGNQVKKGSPWFPAQSGVIDPPGARGRGVRPHERSNRSGRRQLQLPGRLGA